LKKLRRWVSLRPSDCRAVTHSIVPSKSKGGPLPVPQGRKKALPFAAKANPTGEV
jgi:hypothetical protein